MIFLRRWTIAVLAVAAGLARPAPAQVFSYSTNARQVKVGILIPRGFTAPSVSPSFFYALDQRPDLKPSGWQLSNPLAPDQVDTAMALRWNASGQASPGIVSVSDPYQAGQALHKDMAGYWEVPLDSATPDQLSQFNLLYLGGSLRGQGVGGLGGIGLLTEEERDKLRKAVDSGVVLWVEDNGLIGGSLGLFFGLDYVGGAGFGGSVTVAQPLHPALNGVYTLGQGELDALFGSGSSIGASNALNQLDSFPVTLNTLLQASNRTVVAAGPYGSGYVVMSSGIGSLINDSVRKGTQPFPWAGVNRGGYSGNDVSRVPVSALKFAFNVLAVDQESPQERRDTRRDASTPEQIGAPLTRKWTFPDSRTDPTVGTNWPTGGLPGAVAAPAVFKGVVFVPAANGHLYAFDLDPARDLDGDGNPDDGIGPNGGPIVRPYDFGLGAPYDMIWDADIASTINTSAKLISTPTVATVNDPARGPLDIVYVTTSDGNLWAFEAFPRTGANQLSGAAVPYWKKPVQIGGPYPAVSGVPIRVPAPVFGEGRLFVAGVDGSEGVVSELDPVTGRFLWQYERSKKPSSSVPPSIGAVTATPALAWVHDDSTGAADLVLYVPCFSEPAQGQTARIFSFLLSVRGERLTDSGDHQQFRSRYWLAPTNFPWSRVAIHGPGGLTGTPIATRPGWVQVNQTVQPGTPVIADYDLNESSDTYKPRSAFYGFPGTNGQYPDFMSSPVIGPDDTLYAVATDLGRGISSVYAFRDQTPIAYVKWRYTLPAGQIVLGPPAYANGALYVATNRGEIVGFDTNPTFYVDLNGQLDESRKFQIQIIQEDPSLPKAFQTVAFTYNQSMFDASNVTDVDPITSLARVHMRINLKSFSLSGSTALDASLPVEVRYPTIGQTAQATETAQIKASTSICGDRTKLFTTVGSGNDANKLFDQPIGALGANGSSSILSGPSVAGDSLYVTTRAGEIWVIPDDPCALTGAGAALGAVRPTRATIPTPAQLMEQLGGAQGGIVGSVVFSGGNLVANTPGGVMVFQQPTTLVADASRILEIRNSFGGADAAVTGTQLVGSQIVWSLPETTRYNAVSSPGLRNTPAFTGLLPTPEKISFAHPAAARRLSSTNFLVADTGNNRVVEVDRSGTVLWELTGFADPDNILGGAESLTLNTPTDAQRWTAVGQHGEAEIHTLIVDNGNHRVLEIVDAYPRNSAGVAKNHVLAWASRTTQPGSSATGQSDHFYEFRSAQRVVGGIEGLPPGDYTIATVANWRINSVDGSAADTPGSSLVILSGPRRDANGVIVRTPAGAIVDPGGVVVAFARDLTFANGQTQPLDNPTSFQRFYTGAGANQWRGLLTDGNGFYEVSGKLNPATFEITLPVVDGRVGRPGLPGGLQVAPQALGVVMAKRLPSGNTLLVNQATGLVYEFDKLLGVLPVSPSTSGTHALAQPTFADRSF